MRSFIGIDLGTTYSAVAKINEDGKPVIVHDYSGDNLTPSCIALDPASGEISVGRNARGEIVSGISSNAAECFKRKMGSSEIYTLAGEDYTPTGLSAELLKYLISERADMEEIEEVVVTVPANFANEAREATMEAIELAGLKATYIINEPTAAALCYSFMEGLELEGTYAIYDMGGGTFDISIIRFKGRGEVEVLTSNGARELGGIDFDDKLKEFVEEKYQSDTGEAAEDGDFDRQKAEDLKIVLSKQEKKVARINRKNFTITRQEFEALISSKIDEAELLCKSTLDEIKLKPSDITGVLCAGGSTRIPLVQESIKRAFGQDSISKANVDEVVALGAALYAAYKGDHDKLSSAQREVISKLGFTECTGQFYGTVAMIGRTGEEREINSILIKKNTKIPCEVSKTFYTTHEGQTGVNCQITEASTPQKDLQFVKIVAKHKLKLPAGRPAKQEVKVTYQYDDNQIMRCSFLDVSSGEKIEILYQINLEEDADSDK